MSVTSIVVGVDASEASLAAVAAAGGSKPMRQPPQPSAAPKHVSNSVTEHEQRHASVGPHRETMFKKILVPVDLTDKNLHAVRTARDLALRSGGEVCLQHVIEELDVPYDELKDFYQALEQKSRRKLDGLSACLRDAGINLRMLVCYGKRAKEIVSYAGDSDVDLIVITSHKLGPETLTTDIMTISHQVAIAAPCPVLILR